MVTGEPANATPNCCTLAASGMGALFPSSSQSTARNSGFSQMHVSAGVRPSHVCVVWTGTGLYCAQTLFRVGAASSQAPVVPLHSQFPLAQVSQLFAAF